MKRKELYYGVAALQKLLSQPKFVLDVIRAAAKSVGKS
jgi:hypothetical protein